MLVHFEWMKKKLSVRGFQDYINSGSRLEFRAFDLTWRSLFPNDQKRARKQWQIAEQKMRDDAYAEALLLCNGDTIEAEFMLIKQLIAPPSFTTISHCPACRTLPAKQPPQGIEPSCAWCGFISVQEQEI